VLALLLLGLFSVPLVVLNAAAATKAKAIPADTTRRIGDQLNGLQILLKSDHKDIFPFTVDWASFSGGPAMLQAFQSNAIDIGIVGSTPPIFAQAAHQDVVAGAAYETAPSADDLVSAPGEAVSECKALKGQSVVYQQGTIADAVVLAGLHSVRLKLSDRKTVNLPSTDVPPGHPRRR
jgi:sulfonate transport system substrate-binding protein